MGVKHILGWTFLVAGALGAYNQYTITNAAAAGTPSAVSMFAKFDPATLLSIPQGTGMFAAPMLTDIGIAGIGAWLIWG